MPALVRISKVTVAIYCYLKVSKETKELLINGFFDAKQLIFNI